MGGGEQSAWQEIRALMARSPFDTTGTVLAQRARFAREDAPALLAIAAWCAVIRDELSIAAQLAEEARERLADLPDADGVAAWVDATAMMIHATRGRTPIDHALLDRLGRAVPCAEVRGGSDDIVRELSWLLEVPNWFTFADRYDDAATLLDGRLAHLDPTDRPDELVSALCCLAELDLRRARWDNASAHLDRALAVTEEVGHDAGYVHALAARVAACRGRAEACERHIAAAWSSSLRRGDRTTRWRAIAAEGLLATSQGQWRHAHALLLPLRDQAEADCLHLAAIRQWDGDLLDALVHLGDVPEARRTADALAAEHRRVPTTWTWGILRRAEAQLEADPEAAIAAADESALAFDRIGAIFEAARSRLVLAETLLRHGRTDTARAAARSAWRTFTSLDSPHWAARAVRIAQPSQPEPVPPRWPRASFEALTPQELLVARTVVAGATNKEVAIALSMSVKTVETHLTRIYRKLEVRSRAEMVAAYLTSDRHR